MMRDAGANHSPHGFALAPAELYLAAACARRIAASLKLDEALA
jgi:hypothetical protein